MIRQGLHDPDDVGVAEEHETAVAVVIGERAEGLGSQCHLRVELQRLGSELGGSR